MTLFCPFCSEEIAPAATECLSCERTYNPRTLSFLDLSQKAQDAHPHDSRKQVRFPMKLRVMAHTPEAFLDQYTSNLSLGGLFVETKTLLKPGRKFDLKMFLFDTAGPMQIPCEVVWSRNEEKLTATGKFPKGMGVKFLSLSAANIERLIDISNRSLS